MQADHETTQHRKVGVIHIGISSSCLTMRYILCSERDMKSHAMRSKLLSLHLVLTILNSHMNIFVEPSSIIYSSSSNENTAFIQATKQYLCLCISRNAVSLVPQVFELSVELFWRVLSGLRTKLKVRGPWSRFYTNLVH